MSLPDVSDEANPPGATDSPAAARRRLRFALRNAREARHLIQAEVAAGLEWSVSKINRIENGEVTISPTDLRALITFLGLTDPQEVALLADFARIARRRGWWDAPEFRAHITPAMRQLVQFEAEATAIRCFQPTLIPGILQTPEYARSVLEFWSDLPEDTRASRRAIRAERRRRIFDSTDRPEYYMLIDESVIERRVGGSEVMVDQLRDLVTMIRAGRLVLRVVPLVYGAMIGQSGSFTIIDLLGDESAAVYREMLVEDDIRDDRETVERFRRVFEQMWDLSLTPDDSATLIEGRIVEMTPIIRPRTSG